MAHARMHARTARPPHLVRAARASAVGARHVRHGAARVNDEVELARGRAKGERGVEVAGEKRGRVRAWAAARARSAHAPVAAALWLALPCTRSTHARTLLPSRSQTRAARPPAAAPAPAPRRAARTAAAAGPGWAGRLRTGPAPRMRAAPRGCWRCWGAARRPPAARGCCGRCTGPAAAGCTPAASGSSPGGPPPRPFGFPQAARRVRRVAQARSANPWW